LSLPQGVVVVEANLTRLVDDSRTSLVGICVAVVVDELRRGAVAATEEGDCSVVDEDR
jgi:hypothetical protein